ncbi:S8 family serine peptidase [Clostridium paraputrificum]|uniref:S8 family serine peptidase n=1 Tax=Clostridium paraputrificum TaxID=29363 RepID=UPI003D32AFC1
MRGLNKFKKVIAILLTSTMVQGTFILNVSAKDEKSDDKLNIFYQGNEVKPLIDKELESSKLDSKLDSKLLELTGNQKLTKSANSMVYVYIKTKTGEGTKIVEPYINKIGNIDSENKLFTAWVNVDKIKEIKALDEVINIEIVIKPNINVATEGDQLHRADLVRKLNSGSNGKGMKVGVISDGVDHLNDSVKKGALPSNVTVLSNKVTGDEGTAMLEIVHALAPGADLYFNDCGEDKIGFNKAVDNLVAAGCNIIVDDISWITEPFFEDGIVATHVKDVIKKTGICYMSSAGNSATSHYTGLYYNGGYNNHDFSSGKKPDDKNMYIRVKPGESAIVVLQWDDQFGNSNNDYDLYLRDMNGNIIGESSAYQNGAGSNPLEAIQYTNNTSNSIDAVIDVKNSEGEAAQKTLELYIYGENYINNVVSSDSIFGQAAVPEVITVGAIEASAPNEVANYSSQGPVSKLNNVKINKPDISGAAGVSVTGAGGFPTKFSGTSAAAPHIAAIVALLWSKNPGMTNNQVSNLVKNNAKDMGTVGYDSISGNGKADALDSYLAMKPIAVINRSNTTYKGFNVNLNGKESLGKTGTTLKYNWALLSKPTGSQAQLGGATTATPSFKADLIGNYKVSLTVNDGSTNSDTVYIDVKAKNINSTIDDIDESSVDTSKTINIGKDVKVKPIALTDGWVITADNTNKIKILNVISSEVAKEYQLTSVPNCIDFDFDRGIIIASVKDEKKIIKIDVNTDEVTEIATTYSYGGITFGEEGYAFAYAGIWPKGYISTIDLVRKQVVNSIEADVDDVGSIIYDKDNNNLFLAEKGISPSSIYRYTYNESSKGIQLQQSARLGGNGLDLAMSWDKKHIAFSCGGGNGSGYTIFDIDSSDITKTFGEWNTGSYPTAASFTSDSKYIITSNSYELKLFSVKYHTLLKTIKRGGADNNGKVLFSRGGKLIHDFDSGTFTSYKSGIMPADVNTDNRVDIKDISEIAKSYNSKPGDKVEWDSSLDLNHDNFIDIYDLVLVSKEIKQ